LNDLANAATGSIAVVGRRTAIAAASAGLIVSTFAAAPAGAANGAQISTANLSAVDTSALTASARAVLASAPVVTVAADAQFTLDVPAVTVVKDPPPPPPPAPVVKKTTRTTATASRSSSRAAAPAAESSGSAEAAPAASSAPASANGSAIISIASQYVGVPYVSGGTSPSGFDCSGFTSYVFAQVGISLPRTSGAQRGAGTVVSYADAQPGDLIWSPGHISIYAGDGMQIDAPRPGKTIQFRSIWQSSPTFIRVG
jgi:cell wall-associated NlpC family hydrolase